VIPTYVEDKEQRGEPQLLLIASDGELYGHHQQFRDRFLAHLINGASSDAGLEKTYPTLWLKKYPVKRWVSIRDDTSWSCLHGIERWRGDCECSSGDGSWKQYLRQAFNQLANQIDNVYVAKMAQLHIDPWKLRNSYIHVVLGELPANDLIFQNAGRRLDENVHEQVRLLLNAQWERQRIFTSCTWYFDDFSRIEPRNSIAYAAQAVRLTYLATGVDLSSKVKADLKKVISQETGVRGDTIFMKELQKPQPVNSF
jgi:hypothetical protein